MIEEAPVRPLSVQTKLVSGLRDLCDTIDISLGKKKEEKTRKKKGEAE